MDFNTPSHFGPVREDKSQSQPAWLQREYDSAPLGVIAPQPRRAFRIPIWPGLWLRLELESKRGPAHVQKI